jgi:hypothetical protein
VTWGDIPQTRTSNAHKENEVEMAIRPCEPRVRESRSGWLATTPRDHPYRIGVVGSTEEEARRRFEIEFAAWEDLHDRAEKLDEAGTVKA